MPAHRQSMIREEITWKERRQEGERTGGLVVFVRDLGSGMWDVDWYRKQVGGEN